MPTDGTNLDRSEERADGTMPAHRTLEVFKVVDGGNGLIGLWNPTNKRFVRMTTGTHIDKSALKEDGTLPSGRPGGRFKIVYTNDGLIGLWNPQFKRFIKMTKDGTKLERSLEQPDGDLPSWWTWEMFKFVEVSPKPGTRIQEGVGW